MDDGRGGARVSCWLLAGVIAAASGARAQEPGVPVEARGAPVVLDERTLFHVHERVASFSPEERARAIGEKLRRLSRDPLFSAAAIELSDDDSNTLIVHRDVVLMTVTERDARALGEPRQALAARYAQVVREAIVERQQAFGLRSVLLAVLYTALATAVLLVLLRLLGLLFPRVRRTLESWRGSRIPALRIQRLELIPADRITDVLIGSARLLRVALVVLLLYVYVPLVLSFFPWTRAYATRPFEWIATPLGTVFDASVDFLPKAVFILVIALVFFYLTKLVRFLFDELAKGSIALPGFYPDWAMPTYKIVRFLLVVLAVIVAFPYLPGSESPAFKGVSFFVGLLISLGSTSAIANVVAGVLLTYTRAFQVGDRVKLGDTVGDVTAKTLLVTRVRTIKNVDIAVPNAMVLGSHIINYSSSSASRGLILNTSVTIGYDAPWRRVHELLIAAARATRGVQPEPEPFVLQTSLNDFYVTYELNAFTAEPATMARIYSELHENIQDRFNEAGVEILSPHYRALRDGNRTAIPADCLPPDYRAPAFRVESPRGAVGPEDRGRSAG